MADRALPHGMTAKVNDAAKFSRWMDCDPIQHPCRWVWEEVNVRCKTCGSGFTQAGMEIAEELLERGRHDAAVTR